MKEIVKELRNIITFKNTTVEGDVVLVAMEKSKSVFYAIVSEIVRDLSKKDEWWHVSMHILSVPPQKVTWTLREQQFTGQEIFSMANDGRFVQAVDFEEPIPPVKSPPLKLSKKASKKGKTVLRVIK